MKRIIAMILVVVMALALVACGGGGTTSKPAGSDKPAGTETPAGTGTTTDPAKPLSKAEQLKKDNADKYGGEFNVIFGGTSPTMDFHSSNAGSLYVNRFALHIYENLLTADANGKIYPCICDYEVSADGLTYKLTLLDRHFSTGEKIEMEDIEASLRRYVGMNYTTQSGYDKMWKGTTWKIEGDTITFQLASFNINFETVIKSISGSFKIMPKEICEKWAPDWTTGTYDPATDLTWGCTKVNEITDVKDIIGSGPYCLEKWLGDSEIVLVRNENYEMIVEGNEDAIGAAAPRMAYADKIIFKVSTDSATNTAATLAGEFQLGAVQADMWETALSMGLKKWDAGTSWTHGIFFNLHETNTDSPVADVNVRKAIRAAIDPYAVILAVTGRDDRVVLDPYSVLKSNAYYSSNIMEEKGDYKQDLAKAKEYLAQSSYKGEPIVYLFHASGNFYKAAMAVIPMLESIGLNIEAKIVDNGSHTAMRKDPATGHDIGCWEVQKNEENPVLHGTFVTGTQGWWTSPAKEAAIAIMKTTPTGSKESVDAYNDYLQCVIDECPYILFGHVVGFTWTQGNVQYDCQGQTSYYWNHYIVK